MEWFLNLWFIKKKKKSSQKFTTLLIIFSISAQWTFFFFLQKNKTVPWWLKLKQNKTTATATFYSMQHCNTWIGATASLWEPWPNCMLSSSVPNAFTKRRATRTPQDCGPSHSCCLQCAIVFSFGKLLKYSLLYMVPWFIFTLQWFPISPEQYKPKIVHKSNKNWNKNKNKQKNFVTNGPHPQFLPKEILVNSVFSQCACEERVWQESLDF